jgi:hypothetical protein
MLLTTEETFTLALRRRAFEAALSDPRVQGALIVLSPLRVPRLAVCPCCRYPTISVRGDYDSCAICHWQDDGLDDEYADELNGLNGLSLTAARQNFIDHGFALGLSDRRIDLVRRWRSAATERNAVIAVYESLLPDVKPWMFIDRMREIDGRLHALSKREYPRDRVPKPDAATAARRREDVMHQAWSAVAAIGLPRWRRGSSPPSLARHSTRVFERVVRDADAVVRAALGVQTSAIAMRVANNHAAWTTTKRDAWMWHSESEHAARVTFEPDENGERDMWLSLLEADAGQRAGRAIARFLLEDDAHEPRDAVPGTRHSAEQH